VREAGKSGDRRSSPLFLLWLLVFSAPAAALGESEYKLQLHDSREYRLRDADEYRLRAPWRIEKRLPAAIAPATNYARLLGRPFHEHIVAAARAHNLDSALVHAVIVAESNYQSAAISPKGAVGLMQVLPETGARYGVLRGSLLKPEPNIRTGTRYLAELLQLFNGNLELALAGYNAGEYAVIRYGHRIPPFAETRAYVARVLRIYGDLRSY
jgi:soluble lytic murein transglycosylase-like protein